jgi:glycosyltransferase involved in cell wall biosynthesis
VDLPVVTIVTPSFNQGGFIRATIESVLAQEYPRLEYIVMDGGSTDQTAAIAAEYGSRLTWISEKDRGQAHAINKGFQRAKGDIVAWLNSDDLLLPGAVAKAVAAFAAAPPRTGAVYGEGYTMDREGRITGRFPATEPFNLWKLAYLSDYVLQQSAFMRRTAVAEIGWLDEDLQYALDWDLFIRLGKRFGLYYFPEYLGVLREYQEAKSFAGGQARIEEIRQVLERHTNLRRAPGYWIYRADDAQRRWRRPLDDAPLPVIGSLLGWLVYFTVSCAIWIVIRRAQALYPDRAVGRTLHWMLPEGAGDVEICGTVPDRRSLSGQKIRVSVNGATVGEWPVGPGAFRVRFPAPGFDGAPFRFEVHASQATLPDVRRGRVGRRISWELLSIHWVTDGAMATGVPEVLSEPHVPRST